ncbi:MAG: hypothetical protein JWM27_2165 [Gemmatimonadetes bacterium]|nr:hypothetical protein [Gemmatimonadota bacterium]
MDQKKSNSLGMAGGVVGFATALALAMGRGGGVPQIPPEAPNGAAVREASLPPHLTGPALIRRFLQQAPDSARCGPPPAQPCYDFDVVIATVPDPDDSHLDYAYDANLEALQKAFEAEGYALDRFWLPWGDRTDVASPAAYARRDALPGVLLFRGEPADSAGPPRMRLLYLVGEVPTTGVHTDALVAALGERESLLSTGRFFVPGPGLATIKIVGPTFSGSARSLRTTLDTWERALQQARKRPAEARRGPTPGGRKRAQPPLASRYGGAAMRVSIITGSATRDDNREVLADSPRIVFGSAVHSLREYGDVLGQVRSSLRLRPQEIAILEESGTLYGRAQIGKRDSLLHISLPMNVSGVRDQADGQIHGAQGGSLTALLQSMHASPVGLSLKGGARPRESPRPVSDLTPAATGIVLDELIRTLEKNRIRAVGLQFTDVRDNLFLAREVRQRLHGVQLFTFDANALYLRPDRNESLNGMLVFSSYPMMVESQDWGRIGTDDARTQQLFASAGAEGTYNAALMQLGAFRHLVDYAWPTTAAATRFGPPVWVLAVGANSFVPVQVARPGGSYVRTVAAADLVPPPRGPGSALRKPPEYRPLPTAPPGEALRSKPCALPQLSPGCRAETATPTLAVTGALAMLVAAVAAALHSLLTFTTRALPVLVRLRPGRRSRRGVDGPSGRAGDGGGDPGAPRSSAHRVPPRPRRRKIPLPIYISWAIVTGERPPALTRAGAPRGWARGEAAGPNGTASRAPQAAAADPTNGPGAATGVIEGPAPAGRSGEPSHSAPGPEWRKWRPKWRSPWKRTLHDGSRGAEARAGLAEQERRVHSGSLLLHREVYLGLRLVALGGMVMPVGTLLLSGVAPWWLLWLAGAGAVVVWLAAVVTCVMLSALILANHHGEAREYARRHDRRRRSRGWPWYLEIAGGLAVIAFGLVYTALNAWLFEDLRRVSRDPLAFALLRHRLMDGGSGVSPVVPLLLIGGGLLAWCTWHLARVQLLSEITSFEDAFVCRAARATHRHGDARATIVLAERLAKVRSALFLLVPGGRALGVAASLLVMLLLVARRFRPTLENVWVPARGDGYDIVAAGLHLFAAVLVVGAVTVLFARRRRHVLGGLAGGAAVVAGVAAWAGPRAFRPWIHGWAPFDLLLATGVLGSVSATVWGVYRLVVVWSAFRGFLTVLEATPLLPALNRIPPRISRLARLTLYGSAPQQTIDSALHALWRRVRDLHRDHAAAIAGLLCCRESEMVLKTVLKRPHWRSRQWFWSRRRVGVPFGRLYNVAERLWKQETSAGAVARLRLPEPGADAAEAHGPETSVYVGFPEDVREFVTVLEDFLALQVVDYIQWVLEALHKLAIFLFVSLLLGTALLSTYPFHAQSVARVVFVCVMLATVGSLLMVMVQTNRDEVLSRIAGTPPGRITWDSSFVFNGLLLALAPLMALVSSEFPALREVAFSWLAPVVKLLGGG